MGRTKVLLRKNGDDNLRCPLLPSCAQDRVPFVVAERVPWEKMCETLNLKFMAEVGTNRGLLPEHFLFLAQKIFNDNSLSTEAFQHRSVSWSQFNKVIPLPFRLPTPKLFIPGALGASPTSAQGPNAGILTMPHHASVMAQAGKSLSSGSQPGGCVLWYLSGFGLGALCPSSLPVTCMTYPDGMCTQL